MAVAIALAAAAAFVAYQTLVQTRRESQIKPQGLVQALVRWLGKAESPKQPDAGQEQATLARIGLVQSAIRKFRETTGRAPSSLDELVERKLLDGENLYDGFGGPIRYIADKGRILTAGPDRQIGTNDDFVGFENSDIVERGSSKVGNP